jgi:hypothetical protein
MKRLLFIFMIGNSLFRLAASKCLSLRGGKAGIGASLFAARLPLTFSPISTSRFDRCTTGRFNRRAFRLTEATERAIDFAM